MIFNKKSVCLTLIFCLIFALCSCGVKGSETDESSLCESFESSTIEIVLNEEPEPSDAQQVLNKMTLKEKVCQLFVVPVDDVAGKYNTVAITEDFLLFYNEFPVGGYILFEDNLKNHEQSEFLLKNLNNLSFNRFSIPTFLTVDEEGGKVARIGNNEGFNVEKFDNMFYTESADKAFYIGNTIGAYLKNIGFNVDLAPVADVFSNSENEVIGVRSFSNDPYVVCEYALNYANGLKANGIYATYKHFPGHGATKGDTHVDYAFTDKTYEELMECELLPFKSAADNNIPFIMTSHISLPSVLGDYTPVTFSYEAVTGILKNDLGYKGLVITDSLKMGAISKHYSSAEAAVLAFKAGNDLLLMPENIPEAVNGIIDAVNKGEISEDRLNQSVLKIIEYKLKIK